MLVDYHTHHYRCGHAQGTLAEYVEAGINAGLAEIGLSDHSPIYHLGDSDHVLPGNAMAKSELPRYIQEMLSVKKEYSGRIIVRLGVESDYVANRDNYYRKLWSRYPLDYVIGSVHWLGNWSIFSVNLPKGRSLNEVYTEYLYTIQMAARSRAFDIIGHLDALKIKGHWPTDWKTPLLEETLRVIAEQGLTVELNTSGWRKRCRECMPSPELLALCHHYGIPVTLGSDAHSPEQVASDFEKAVKLLRDVGYRHITIFSARKPSKVEIG